MEDFLRREGFDVRVFSPRAKLPAVTNLDGRSVFRIKEYETRRRLLGSPLAALFAPWSLVAYLRAIEGYHPGVLVISGSSPFLLVESLLAAKLSGIPVLFDVQDSWLLMGEFHPGRLRNAFRRTLERLALSHGDVVVGVTQGQVDLLCAGYHLDSTRLMFIPNGARPAPTPARSEPPQYDLIHAGPPRDYYATESFLDALAILRSRLPKLRAAFVGVTEGPEKARWTKGLERRGLQTTVDLLPPVPHRDMANLLRTARVGVVTLTDRVAYKVAVSTKSYDYLAAGLPILYLGPSDSEQTSLIERYHAGLTAESPAEFASNAEMLLTDTERMNDMRDGVRRASADFDWDNILRPFATRLAALATAGT